jgi:hypothetical protein
MSEFQNQIMSAFGAQAALTFGMGAYALMLRGRLISAKPEILNIKTRATRGRVFEEIDGPADNFMNLFEVPTIFFAWAGILVAAPAAVTNVSQVDVGLAWTFVALRSIHSAYQATRGRVLHRFYAYAASSAVLAGAVAKLVLSYRAVAP